MKTDRPLDTIKITIEVSCTSEVVKQLNMIVADKGQTPFDLINLFPAYLRTAQVFVKEIYGTDHYDGNSTHGISLMGTQPVEKSQPIGNKPTEPTEFNYLVVGSHSFIRDRERKKNRDKIIKEFPNVPEHLYTIQEAQGRNDLSITAGIFEDKHIFENFCKANNQNPENVLDHLVVFICDSYNMGRGDNLYLANPKVYHTNITSKYEK